MQKPALRISCTGKTIKTSGLSIGDTLPENSGGAHRFCRASSTTNVHLRVGFGSQTAELSDLLITPYESVILNVTACTHFAVIAAEAGGFFNIFPVEF